jgi:hypothetical protein
VTGFEGDPWLTMKSEEVRTELGISNVSFRCTDFLGLPPAELRPFQVIYFYIPFMDDVVENIDALFIGLTPGTTVIAEAAERYEPDLFPARYYDRHPASHQRVQIYGDELTLPGIFRRK